MPQYFETYKSRSGGKSGVTGFRIGSDYIIVAFKNEVYKYTYQTAGTAAVLAMQQLAAKSEGLSTYISQNSPGYE